MDIKQSKIITDVVLVNGNDKEIGTLDKVKAHKYPLSLHRAVSVVLFSSMRDEMLIQRRSPYKPTWPLFWSNTVCTHPYPGESAQASAERRLKEEMGINCSVSEKFSFTYKEKYDKEYGEHEIDHVFVGEYSGEIKPDPKEVTDYKWIKIADLNKDINKNPDKYTPWFKTILKKLKI